MFSCEFCESFQNTFFVEHVRVNTSEKGVHFNESWFHCTNFDCEKLCHYLLSHVLPWTSSNDDISNPIYILQASFLALFVNLLITWALDIKTVLWNFDKELPSMMRAGLLHRFCDVMICLLVLGLKKNTNILKLFWIFWSSF